MTSGPLNVVKYGAVIPASREWCALGAMVETERQRMDRDREYAARKEAATAAWPVFVAALDALSDPVARAVLDLHKSDDGYCRGCDADGYEWEPPGWPCSTTGKIAEVLGIEVPPDLYMAEQSRV